MDAYKDVFKKLGVAFKLNTFVGSSVMLDDMFHDGYEAVFIAVGTAKPNRLGLLELLEQPDSGRIIIGGEEITEKDVDIYLIRNKIGMVYQGFHLFEYMNVLATICMLAKHNMTMLIVAHEMTFARKVATLVLYLDECGIFEEGKPEELVYEMLCSCSDSVGLRKKSHMANLKNL